MTPEQQQTYLDWVLSAKRQAATDAYDTPLHLTVGTKPYDTLGTVSTILDYGVLLDPREFGYTYDPTSALSANTVYFGESLPTGVQWGLVHGGELPSWMERGVWTKTDPSGKEYYWGSFDDPLLRNYIGKFNTGRLVGGPVQYDTTNMNNAIVLDNYYAKPTPENIDKVLASAPSRLSPLSGREIVDALNYVAQSPEYDFVDLMGRVIAPGTTIGNYTYNPTPERVAALNESLALPRNEYGEVQYAPSYDPHRVYTSLWDPDAGEGSGAGLLTDPMYSMWQYTDPNTGITTDVPHMPYSVLHNAGIAPDQRFGGSLSPSGWMALSSVLGAAGGVVGAVAGAATSGGFSIGEAVQAGATAADLADLGFSTGQILAYSAANPSSILANQISSGTGLGAGISQGLAQGSVGALKGYGMSGGNPVSALSGGLSGVAGGYVGTEVGPFAGQLASTGASLGVNYLNQPTSGGASPAPKTPAQSSLLTGGSQNALTNLLADQATQPPPVYSPLAYKNIFG